ncbi:NmrA family NAD(P)-binding protein [Spirosoma radiotolerans]|uniref:NAD-dependent dehydratase n=1 Tax=Spirosoma radiotolerans TaxID=1379870 RepID=A0A0E3ZTK1_9BACT|nr:NAD(P)H-binding protein [Spirosoma radiotolerans]AKD53874.1 NAD-dependent dehydratase [Spirosoma radiotolerans]
MNIIITGSLGNISKPLATQLIANGHRITIISSKPDKQQAIEKLGAKAAIGRLEDASFLTSTFTGADAVYCMIPFDLSATDQKAYFQKIATNYVQAINETGVRKVVLLTGWAAGLTGSFEATQLADQLSHLAFTELRPSVFYSNFYGYIPMIKQQGAIVGNYGGNDRIAVVAPEDIAAAAAEELTDSSNGNRVRYVASEELTCNEVAGILGEAIGRPDLQWVIISDEALRNGLLQMGMPAQLADELVKMQAAMHSGVVYENYLRHRPVLGKTKLRGFAKDFAKAYYQQ